jgi:hypothetical protein
MAELLHSSGLALFLDRARFLCKKIVTVSMGGFM